MPLCLLENVKCSISVFKHTREIVSSSIEREMAYHSSEVHSHLLPRQSGGRCPVCSLLGLPRLLDVFFRQAAHRRVVEQPVALRRRALVQEAGAPGLPTGTVRSGARQRVSGLLDWPLPSACGVQGRLRGRCPFPWSIVLCFFPAVGEFRPQRLDRQGTDRIFNYSNQSAACFVLYTMASYDILWITYSWKDQMLIYIIITCKPCLRMCDTLQILV